MNKIKRFNDVLEESEDSDGDRSDSDEDSREEIDKFDEHSSLTDSDDDMQ